MAVEGTPPDVGSAMASAHMGLGPAHAPSHGLASVTEGRGASVVGQPAHGTEGMKGYGSVTSGQVGHPGTD